MICFAYNIVPRCNRNQYLKNKMNRIILTYKNLLPNSKKSACIKWTYGLSGNDYSVAALSKSYLTVIGIIMQSLKSIGQF